VTTVDLLHLQLDETPADQTLRLALADALLEADDPRGYGYRALAVNGKWPLHHKALFGFYGWLFAAEDAGTDREHGDRDRPVGDGNYRPRLHCTLPKPWYAAVERQSPLDSRYWVGYRSSRREVEDRAAAAFLKLRPHLQRKLLSGSAIEGKVQA
jgi:hypothetical protein